MTRNRDLYVIGVNATGIVLAWVGLIAGPLFILSSPGDFTHPNTYFGLVLLLGTVLTIRSGFKAKKKGNNFGFIVSAIMPIVIPIGCIMGVIIWSASA